MIKFLCLIVGLSTIVPLHSAEKVATLNKKNLHQLAVIKKSNSLQSVEDLLKSNESNHDKHIEELLRRIQNTKELLASMMGQKISDKEKLRREIEKFNNSMKEIVDQYNAIVMQNNSSDNIPDTETETLPKISSSAKEHAIVTLDWRKKLRFDSIHNPIQELLSPLTEENVQEFWSIDYKEPQASLERKDIPDVDTSYHQGSLSSAEDAISAIEERKALTQ